jgi:hypothetical protein
VAGFQRVELINENEELSDEFISKVRGRYDWIAQKIEEYKNGIWPLGILAHQTGTDTIEVSEGLVQLGEKIKVTTGNLEERADAIECIEANAQSGCVLDLYTFWTAYRLQILENIERTCGQIHLPRSVMDALYERREKFSIYLSDGLKSTSWQNGQVAFAETPAEVVVRWHDETGKAMTWAEENAQICPVTIGESFPPLLQEQLRISGSSLCDAIAVALQSKILLLSDDVHIRQMGRFFGHTDSTWIHPVLMTGLAKGHIDADRYIYLFAELIKGGQCHLGLTAPSLAKALLIDVQEGKEPGDLFFTLINLIGGKTADQDSHLRVVEEFLGIIWRYPQLSNVCHTATGLLLTQLVSESDFSYAEIVERLSERLKQYPTWSGIWKSGHWDTLRKIPSRNTVWAFQSEKSWQAFACSSDPCHNLKPNAIKRG